MRFEVNRDVGEVRGSWQIGSGEQVTLPLLRSGVIDLEDAEVGVRVAMGEGVESGTEKDVLRDAASDGCG